MLKPAAALIAISIVCNSRVASAQTLSDVLTFLMTNRTIATDDFVRDQQAARAAADAISGFLLIDLNTLPISTSAGGFTYRLDPSVGISVRSNDSFDPFFTRRSLTAGAEQFTFGISYAQSVFHSIDGRALRDGTLISTASRIHGETDYFDVETLAMRVQANTATLVVNYGVSDRFEAGAALPVIRLTLDGQRQDTYRGRSSLQASASSTTTGPGDLLLHGKYEVVRASHYGMALGAETRLPTGSAQNLLGTGKASGGPLVIASIATQRAGIHLNGGYTTGGLTKSIDYSGAATVAALNRLTLIAELVGHRLASAGRLAETVAPHPTLLNVDTVRLTSTDQAISRVVAVAGLKWNFRSTWLISANVVRPLTDTGLNARWTPTVTIDHSFGQ